MRPVSLSVQILKKLDEYTLNVKLETAGERTALLGASGSGRTAALRCIAGFDTPDRGRIVLNDRVLFDSEKRINLSPRRRHIGFLFPDYALFPHMTVRQNLLAAAQTLPQEKRAAAVNEALRSFRLEAEEARFPGELSGVERRRAALARMLLTEPEALLLDEPFAAIDAHLRWQAELELSELLRGYDGDVLLSTSDRGEACRLCETVSVFSNGNAGRKTEVRELLYDPGTVSAAQVSGCENFSRIRRVDPMHVRCLSWGVTLRTSEPVENAVTYVGVHASSFHIAAGGEPNRFDARVMRVIEDAFSTIVLLSPESGSSLLRMELPRAAGRGIKTGDLVLLGVAPERVLPLTGDF